MKAKGKKGFHWGSLPKEWERETDTDRVREQERPYIATGRAASGQEAPCLGMEVSWPAGTLTFPMLVGFLESRIAWRLHEGFWGDGYRPPAGKGPAWFLLSALTLLLYSLCSVHSLHLVAYGCTLDGPAVTPGTNDSLPDRNTLLFKQAGFFPSLFMCSNDLFWIILDLLFFK